MSGKGQNTGWTRESIRSAVQKYVATSHRWETLHCTSYRKYRKAAVLIPLFLCDGVIHVWLTKRSEKVGHYKGQVSFPGGMKEPDDKDDIATSLREAKEEIGLEPNQVEVLGTLYPREVFPKYLSRQLWRLSMSVLGLWLAKK
ncbi:hypothetical protein LSH36_354g01012 [Paralvinella palmiformis]|uniref:Nudix hydrolase domain-containing protein n=1 Tax=Paralvinella palmiformis TaxID=53620 RepID=A0AAD9JFI2_9ANNE|nr:hypothetical protein LSH36_354g01012 [Paralvinella palmiformis]